MKFTIESTSTVSLSGYQEIGLSFFQTLIQRKLKLKLLSKMMSFVRRSFGCAPVRAFLHPQTDPSVYFVCGGTDKQKNKAWDWACLSQSSAL